MTEVFRRRKEVFFALSLWAFVPLQSCAFDEEAGQSLSAKVGGARGCEEDWSELNPDEITRRALELYGAPLREVEVAIAEAFALNESAPQFAVLQQPESFPLPQVQSSVSSSFGENFSQVLPIYGPNRGDARGQGLKEQPPSIHLETSNRLIALSFWWAEVHRRAVIQAATTRPEEHIDEELEIDKIEVFHIKAGDAANPRFHQDPSSLYIQIPLLGTGAVVQSRSGKERSIEETETFLFTGRARAQWLRLGAEKATFHKSPDSAQRRIFLRVVLGRRRYYS